MRRSIGNRASIVPALLIALGFAFAGLDAPAHAQSPMDLVSPLETTGFKASGILSYNFDSEPGWQALVPEVFAGFDENLGKLSPFRIRAGASFAGTPYGAESVDTFRALAAPGAWNASTMVYLMSSHHDDSPILPFIAFGAGLKQIAHGRSDLSALVQFNARFALGVSITRPRYLVLGMEFTRGWHNVTNASEETFQALFHSDNTRVQQLLVTAQSRIPDIDLWVDLSMREVRNREHFPGYEDADRVFSLGLRRDFDLP